MQIFIESLYQKFGGRMFELEHPSFTSFFINKDFAIFLKGFKVSIELLFVQYALSIIDDRYELPYVPYCFIPLIPYSKIIVQKNSEKHPVYSNSIMKFALRYFIVICWYLSRFSTLFTTTNTM